MFEWLNCTKCGSGIPQRCFNHVLLKTDKIVLQRAISVHGGSYCFMLANPARTFLQLFFSFLDGDDTIVSNFDFMISYKFCEEWLYHGVVNKSGTHLLRLCFTEAVECRETVKQILVDQFCFFRHRYYSAHHGAALPCALIYFLRLFLIGALIWTISCVTVLNSPPKTAVNACPWGWTLRHERECLFVCSF